MTVGRSRIAFGAPLIFWVVPRTRLLLDQRYSGRQIIFNHRADFVLDLQIARNLFWRQRFVQFRTNEVVRFASACWRETYSSVSFFAFSSETEFVL